MAEKPEKDNGIQITDLQERLWIQQALELQRQSLLRKRGQERPGSEIHDLRGREIEAIDRLKQKFA